MNFLTRRAAWLLLLAGFALPSFVSASDLDEIPPPPIEWGKVSKADLEMKTFPADTNASAVILCDYGESRVDGDFDLIFTRHLRVKILKEKGFEEATLTIDLYDDRDHGERVDDIEGVTYTLDENGKIVEHELDDDGIARTPLTDKYERVKFTLPALQPGCVFEVRYKITSKSLMFLKNWIFQHSEPVLWSEYRVLHPVTMAFNGVTRGYEKFTVEEESNPVVYYSGRVASYYHTNMMKSTFRRWAMQNIPALRQEPYITTLDDYYSKVNLQFAGYVMQEGLIERVLHTWEELVKDLMDNPYIGQKIRQTGDVEDIAKKVTANMQSPVEKMKALYAWVSNSIVWDGHVRYGAEQTMNEVLESKKGSSAEINYLLISLCRAAGLQADPIILSTRSNGMVQDLYPIIDQFNLAMARVTINGTPYFLDATDPARPYDMVPTDALNVRALVIQDDSKVEWVTIQSKTKSISRAVANVTLDEQGGLKGTMEGLFKDYANINVRTALKKSKPADVAKEYLSLDGSKVTIDSTVVINRDSVDQPIKLKAVISSDSYGQVSGEFLYVNPHLIGRWNDNPFKSAKRKFPVDYNYPREYVSFVNLTLPDSFEVKEALPNKYTTLDGLLNYSRDMGIQGNIVQIRSKFEILNREIAARNYERLKEFYSIMIQAQSEQLVLQKKKPLPAPAPAAAASDTQTQTGAKAKKAAAKKKS